MRLIGFHAHTTYFLALGSAHFHPTLHAAMPLGRRAFSAAALSATLAGVPSPLPAATLAPPSLAQRLATPRFGRLELLKPDPTTSRPDTLHCSVVKRPCLLDAIPRGQPPF